MDGQFILIGIAGLLVVLLVFSLGVQAMFNKSHPEHRKLTPAEERAFEIDPEDWPAIVNYGIEEGVDHPSMAARKAEAPAHDHESDYKAVKATVRGLLKGAEA
jgi:hypothetical protein